MLFIIFISAFVLFIIFGFMSKIFPKLEVVSYIFGILAILSLLTIVVSLVLASIPVGSYKESYETGIVSFQDDSFEGESIMLIKNNNYTYTYYYKTDNNSIMPNTVKEGNTILHPQEVCENPRIIVHYTYDICIIDTNLASILLCYENGPSNVMYEIYFEENAIMEES